MSKNAGSTKFGFGRADKIIVSVALAMLLLCLYGLFIDETFFGFINATHTARSGPSIGVISSMKNDTRHKNFDEISWARAEESAKIQKGDSLFTGEGSDAQVAMKDGNKISLGENTLIVFQEFERGESLANLSGGNYRLNVNGKMKVAIQGEVTEIEGDGSEIQVYLDKKQKPKIKLISGKASVKSAKTKKKIDLSKDIVAALDIQPTKPLVEPPPPEPRIIADTKTLEFKYTNRLTDFYDKSSSGIVLRSDRRKYVHMPVTLNWKLQGKVSAVYGQHSMTAGYDKSVFSFGVTTNPADQVKIENVFIGNNFWRLSFDKKKWIEAAHFQVAEQYLKEAAPEFKFISKKLLLIGPTVTILASGGTPQKSQKRTVVETSSSAEFLANDTRVSFLDTNQFNLQVSEPGQYYFRTRGVNQSEEVTEYSAPQKVLVTRPELPLAPRLANDSIHVRVGERLKLSWKGVSNAKAYSVEIRNQKGDLIKRASTNHSQFEWSTKKVGPYQVKISAQDKWNRASSTSASTASVTVDPLPAVKPMIAKKEFARSVASAEPMAPPSNTNSSKFQLEPPQYLNRKYSNSRLDIEGAGYVMFSRQQVQTNTQNLQGFETTLRLTNWIDGGSNGVEGDLKSKVAGDSTSNYFSAEARLHHRWFVPWNPFSGINQTQFSLLMGYEYYRNSGTGSISPKYDLLKTGFSLNFPLLSQLDTGGEILYGLGFDKSHKYEMAGHLNYYFKSEWSFGVGYRMHLFEAGSASSAPAGYSVPFREAYGEAFSVLGWRY